MRAYDEDIEDVESGRLSFDFRGFLFKALNLWKVIVLSIGLALTVAYFINVRKPNIYRLETIMSVENEQSPFFSSNTSIQFNWGGVSGKVSTVMTAVETRTHNELVVDSLQFFKPTWPRESTGWKTSIHRPPLNSGSTGTSPSCSTD
jgi:tyrosine-protein kinase Etk/Wzc